MTLSFVGLLVGWMMKASTPRTFSPISTKLSTVAESRHPGLPDGRLEILSLAMAAASAGFAFPEKKADLFEHARGLLRPLRGQRREEGGAGARARDGERAPFP